MKLPLAGFLSLAAVLTACSEPAPPTPPPTTRPAVHRAFDISAYSSDDTVCDILPGALRDRLGLRVRGSGSALPENPACFLDGRGSPAIQLFTKTDRLARAYKMNRPGGGTYPHFLGAVTIAGQPAAHVHPTEGSVEFNCVVVVALSETSSLEVQVLADRACARADEVAEAVVAKLAAE